MECPRCRVQMICKNDVNDETVRIDWLECPWCGVKTTIEYKDHGKEIKRISCEM